jgi:RimJ/RimL family protein N-acetyltransferase
MTFTPPPPIETERLVVRALLRSDLPDLMRVNGDARVTRFLPYRRWETLADAEAWLDRMAGIQATGGAHQFVVVDRHGGAAIGTCLLFRYDEGSARAELGYALARDRWGRGYMREALGAVVDHALRVAGLRRLEAEVDPANVASTRLLERLGFVREGVLRQRWVGARGPYDVAFYGLLREEFGSSRG